MAEAYDDGRPDRRCKDGGKPTYRTGWRWDCQMSRLTDLIRQTKERDPLLAAELEREFRSLSSRRAFGLNFERHRPEAVELPGRPVRRGDKARILPPRGSSVRDDQRLWRVTRIERTADQRLGHLEPLSGDDGEPITVPAEDLVVVAEFRDPVFPGLVPTGGVYRGGDQPVHTVINGENFHVLHALSYTHQGKVDAIYIDPPYNTGARDWKYNNDYVEADDLYRHSKWLAFMERRLLLAKELLNPTGSVLVVTIDEKEYLRLGMLLQQIFPGATMQMVSSTINPKGTGRVNEFRRVDEYLYFLWFGQAHVSKVDIEGTAMSGGSVQGLDWQTARRRDLASVRPTRPSQFFPIYVDTASGMIDAVGEPLPRDAKREDAPVRPGCLAVFPIRPDGTEMNWSVGKPAFVDRWKRGYARSGRPRPDEPQQYIIQYLKSGTIRDIEEGRASVTGREPDGSVIGVYESAQAKTPTTQWRAASHSAEHYGTGVVKSLLPDRTFPFPKALYAVEDALRIFISERPEAVVLDFFAGSGTTAHAVMRLNKQDGGRRRSISVTNNEVSAKEAGVLRSRGLRPGDSEWEALGIFEHVTRPRITAAITGVTSGDDPVKGDYKFTDEFPMAEGFEENAEFFTLTYENPVAVGHNRAFERVAVLLWLRAGAEGRRIDTVAKVGWDVSDTYGILFDLDQTAAFCGATGKANRLRIAFIVTDDDRRFQAVARQLHDSVEPVRLYESYLSNFRFTGIEP